MAEREQKHRDDAHTLKQHLGIVVVALFFTLAVVVTTVLVNLQVSRDLKHLSESQARLLACISVVSEPRPTDTVERCLEVAGFHVEVVRQSERIAERAAEETSSPSKGGP